MNEQINAITSRRKFLSCIDIAVYEDLTQGLSGKISAVEERLLKEYGNALGLDEGFVNMAVSAGKKGRDYFRKAYLSLFRNFNPSEFKRHLSEKSIHNFIQVAKEDDIFEPEERALISYIMRMDGYDSYNIRELFKKYNNLPNVGISLSGEDGEAGLMKEMLGQEYYLVEYLIVWKNNSLHMKLGEDVDVLVIDPRSVFDPLILREERIITEDNIELYSHDRKEEVSKIVKGICTPIVLYTEYGDLDPEEWGLDLERDRVIRKRKFPGGNITFKPEIEEMNPFTYLNLIKGIEHLISHINDRGKNGTE